MRNLTGELAQPEVGRFAAVARFRPEGDHALWQDIHRTPDAPASLRRCQWKRDVGAGLNQQPAVGVVIGPLLPIALVTLELDYFADVRKGKVKRRLTQLLHELARVRFVSRGRQFVMNR